MSYLLIQQLNQKKSMKTWKLSPKEGLHTIGQSRDADIRALNSQLRGLHGALEYRQGHWWYLNLNADSNEKAEICIDKEYSVSLHETSLKFTTLEDKPEIFSQAQEIKAEGVESRPYRVIVVKKGSFTLESKVLNTNEKYRLRLDGDQREVNFSQRDNSAWASEKVGDLEIKYRTIHLNANRNLQRVSNEELFDKETRKPLIATLAVSALLAILIGLAPKTSITKVDEFEIPKAAVIDLKNMKSMKKLEKLAQKKSEPSEKPAAGGGSPKADGGNKAAHVVSSIRNTGLSKLIAKVSAAAARSQNVVITKGAAAGSQATGRALASIGSLTGAKDKNWNGQVGKGTGISTAGRGGGVTGFGGMGSMATNGVGSGGVGLLEEESEISGGLDRDVIAQYIKSQLGQILYCYERQLSARPDLYGKVAVKFTISGDGGVETQKINETSLKDSKVEGCILQRVSLWKFPKPEGGTKVVVTYPFLFKSTN